MNMHKAKWLIAGVWLAGAGLVFLILVGQSLLNYYEPRTQDAWGWYLPTVMPTLSLIVGVLVADFHSGNSAENSRPARGVFWLGLALSIFYLSMVALAILIQPVLADTAPLTVMQRSNLWLGPLQGLTAAAIGAFFRSGQAAE